MCVCVCEFGDQTQLDWLMARTVRKNSSEIQCKPRGSAHTHPCRRVPILSQMTALGFFCVCVCCCCFILQRPEIHPFHNTLEKERKICLPFQPLFKSERYSLLYFGSCPHDIMRERKGEVGVCESVRKWCWW